MKQRETVRDGENQRRAAMETKRNGGREGETQKKTEGEKQRRKTLRRRET